MPDKTTGLNEYSVMLNFSLLVNTELKHKLKYSNSAKINFHSPELFSWARRVPKEYLCYGKCSNCIADLSDNESSLENMKMHTSVRDGEPA